MLKIRGFHDKMKEVFIRMKKGMKILVTALLLFSMVILPVVAFGQSGSLRDLSATVRKAEDTMAQIDSYTDFARQEFEEALDTAKQALAEQADDKALDSANDELSRTMLQLTSAVKETRLRVGSFNIRRGGDARNQAVIRDMLDTLDIQMGGFQEVITTETGDTKDTLKNITPEGTQTILRSPALLGGANDGYGIGSFSTYRALHTETIKVQPEGEEQRVLGKMEFAIDGKRISFYNTHVSWLYAGDQGFCRDRQLAFINSIVQNDPNPYKIIVGDFNIEDYAEYDVFAGFTCTNNPDNPYTSYTTDDQPFRNLDNILVTANIDIVDSAMIEEDLSDHNLLFADLLLH